MTSSCILMNMFCGWHFLKYLIYSNVATTTTAATTQQSFDLLSYWLFNIWIYCANVMHMCQVWNYIDFQWIVKTKHLHCKESVRNVVFEVWSLMYRRYAYWGKWQVYIEWLRCRYLFFKNIYNCIGCFIHSSIHLHKFSMAGKFPSAQQIAPGGCSSSLWPQNSTSVAETEKGGQNSTMTPPPPGK